MINKPNKPNQDNYFYVHNLCAVKNITYLGVCDGHGLHGHLVSDYVKSQLPSNITTLFIIQEILSFLILFIPKRAIFSVEELLLSQITKLMVNESIFFKIAKMLIIRQKESEDCLLQTKIITHF